MRIVRLLHGFNERTAGSRSTDTLKPWFDANGFRAITDDYGWLGLASVHICNNALATLLAEDTKWLVEDLSAMLNEPVEVYGVGHSNGCAILNWACDKGAPFKQLALVSPALDTQTTFAPQLERIRVFWSDWDIPTRAASLIPFSGWGAMGAHGYRGKDKRVWNYRMNELFPNPVRSHTGVFKDAENQKVLAETIISLFNERLS